MAVTKTNINTYPSLVINSPGEPVYRKEPKKVIKIHKNYEDAVEYAKRVVMPTGAIDTVYYRDANKDITCLIIVGNVPNSEPIIFSGIAHVQIAVDDASEKLVDKVNETVAEEVDKTNTIINEVKETVTVYTLWNTFGDKNTSTNSNASSTVDGTNEDVLDNTIIEFV